MAVLGDQKHDFNPRSREGSDAAINGSGKFDMISIHAPAKGATKSTVYAADAVMISIHAPAKGATAKITYFIQNRDFKLDNTNKSQYF